MTDFTNKIHQQGYVPAAPRQHDLLYAPWMYNPIQQTFPVLTITDIIGSTYAANGSIQLTLGHGNSGEAITKNAMLFNVPGIISLPLPSGTVSTTNGQFTASSKSQESAQAVSYIRNDQWITLGVRDTRSQPLINPALQPGETAIFCQGSKALSTYRVDGAVTHETSDGFGNSGLISLTPSTMAVFTKHILLESADVQATNNGDLQFVAMGPALQSLVNACKAFGTTLEGVPVASDLATSITAINDILAAGKTLATAASAIIKVASVVLKADQ